jgi:hypothetical protein
MTPRGDIVLDDALWPLLLVRFLGVPTTPQVEAYLARMTTFLERGEPYVSILDSSQMTGMGPAEQRQLQVAWLKRHDARLRELGRGTAFVIVSPLVRLAVSVVFHLKSPASAYVVTASLPDAVAWAADRLAEAGQLAAAQRLRHHFGLASTQQTG